MRIRTQIILATFVLAVVPLAAIVTYSYHSSRRALEAASQRESARLTAQMDRRLGTIRAELEQRLALVSTLPIPSATNADAGSNMATVMGEAASFVDALEFHPIREPRAEAKPAATKPEPKKAPPTESEQLAKKSEEDEEEAEEAEEAATEAEPQIAEVAPPPPPMPGPHHGQRIIIDMPPMTAVPQYAMSEEQKELIAEISELGVQLARMRVDDEDRDDVRKELTKAQEELRRVVAADRQTYRAQIDEARRVSDAVRRARAAGWQSVRVIPAPAPPPAPGVPQPAKVAQATRVEPKSAAEPAPKAEAAAPVKVPEVHVREATTKDIEKSASTAKKSTLILGRKFNAPVRSGGELIGEISARISPEQVIRRVLGSATEDGSEVPFALDREGTVYTRGPEDRATLDRLGVPQRVKDDRSLKDIEGWVVTTTTDPQSGLKIGVARPVGDNLEEIRKTAARNLGLGLGLIAFALVGIIPLSNHLTRDVKVVTDGAERIAQGDLMTRLPVKTGNELGQLAKAFNRMAEDLSRQQERLVEQERARKEQELQQRLLAVEYDRKSFELEEARRFQLSMLPKEVPHHPSYDVAVYTRTATEVGGDYYDFHRSGDVLAVTIGDATGHGAKAGTMVTVVKTLFAGYTPTTGPAAFLGDAAEKIKRMDLGRMAMALSIGVFAERKLTLSSAGMPPVLVHRAATNTVEEIALGATPLGTLGTTYAEKSVQLAKGDTVLFLTDGFPELMNDAGQQLGYAAALDAFAEAARRESAAATIDALNTFSARWHGDAPPNDDVTFVIARIQ
ncbi:MAG TPA: SpoIIE family protein phosphatase [Thermoanaerobaculia bacterium]|nr:SpoIIE family protein phosphatase [Thermoanaerobaculia bacterium]